ADRNRSHWSTSKTPSYTKSVSWQHHPASDMSFIYNVRDTTKTSQQKTRSQRRRVRARAAFSASE
ncbi:hypothetical protein, partial [Klebsiella pneumoniae]|uniref:hypothetical protein n=1 Tax=Klebsiella pneumoniae TaxID=573 RepID=UPI001B3C178D